MDFSFHETVLVRSICGYNWRFVFSPSSPTLKKIEGILTLLGTKLTFLEFLCWL